MLLAEQLAGDPGLRGEAFNFSNEVQLTVLELVGPDPGCHAVGLEPDIRNEALNEIRNQSLSAAKARDRLGWSPTSSLDDGLARTVDWYREFLGNSP